MLPQYPIRLFEWIIKKWEPKRLCEALIQPPFIKKSRHGCVKSEHVLLYFYSFRNIESILTWQACLTHPRPPGWLWGWAWCPPHTWGRGWCWGPAPSCWGSTRSPWCSRCCCFLAQDLRKLTCRSSFINFFKTNLEFSKKSFNCSELVLLPPNHAIKMEWSAAYPESWTS